MATKLIPFGFAHTYFVIISIETFGLEKYNFQISQASSSYIRAVPLTPSGYQSVCIPVKPVVMDTLGGV